MQIIRQIIKLFTISYDIRAWKHEHYIFMSGSSNYLSNTSGLLEV